MPKKLSRREIAEGLKTVPIEAVLLGASVAGERQLTHKQRKFAEGIALGKSKAQSYREAYNSVGKPETASRRGQELAQHGAVRAQIEALRLANEARRYATPAALRSLVIERLTAHAIDSDINPAQRLRALELLGKVTEIAAFTERREIIKASDPGQAKAALLENLRAALRATSIDAEILESRPAKGNSVTVTEPAAALATDDSPGSDPGPVDEAPAVDPTHPPPPDAPSRAAPPMLSIPHTRSSPSELPSVAPQTAQKLGTRVTPVTLPRVNPDVDAESVETLSRVTPVTVVRENPSEGGGAIESGEWIEDGYRGDPPGGNWVEK